MVRGFGHEISVTGFIRVFKRESLRAKATAFMDDPLFSKRDTFWVLLHRLQRIYSSARKREAVKEEPLVAFDRRTVTTASSPFSFFLNK